jgi:FixJ family two-component response regulator
MSLPSVSSLERRESARATRPKNAIPRVTAADIVYLVVHDQLLREVLFNVLTLGGYNLLRFESASEMLNGDWQDVVGCVVLDAQIPDMEGVEFQRRLTVEGGPPTIFVSTQADIQSGVRAIKAGAIDFLVDPIEPDRLFCAVDEAFTQHRQIRHTNSEMFTLRARAARLTCREREVFSLVIRGLMNKQVAHELGISPITVQIHRSNVMEKMIAHSFAELVCMAIQLQILNQEYRSLDLPLVKGKSGDALALLPPPSSQYFQFARRSL